MTAPSNFIDFEIGKLGKEGATFVPTKELREYIGTGTSLEDVNKRRLEVRKINQEINIRIKDINTEYMGHAGVPYNGLLRATSVYVPQNKRWFIFAAELLFMNDNTNGTYTSVDAGFTATAAGTSISKGIMFGVLPVAVAGLKYPFQHIALSFPVPIMVQEFETWAWNFVNFSGYARMRLFLWEEDKDLLV